MSNPVNNNDLPPPAKWATLSIAVSPELKARLDEMAAGVGLKPSQYGRMVLMDDIARKTALEAA